MIWTDDGMQIDESEVQSPNARGFMRASCESGSNVTAARLPHEKKQSWWMISTEEGIQMDESDEQP
jgi:hypothetical protein